MQISNLNNEDVNESVGFIIVSYDKENNSITIRPYSPLFKNPEESYPIFNLSLSLLDKTKDLKEEIARAIYPTVQQIIEQEKETPNHIKEQIDNILNKKTIINTNFKEKILADENETSKSFKLQNIYDLSLDFLN
jgi:hypothetical protein